MYESKRDARFQTYARTILRRFINRRLNKPFLAEEFRAFLENEGTVHPADWRSLGWVLKDAHLSGRIKRVGSAPAKTSHGNYKPKWVGV